MDWPNIADGAPTDCVDPLWSTVPPSDLATVRSLRFDFGDTVIDPLESLEFSGPMQAPIGAPTNDEIAWNSFGFYATRTDNLENLLPAEPIKVGIGINAPQPADYGNYVWLDVNGNGIQDDGDANGLNGVTVQLYEDDGDGIADPNTDTLIGFRVTAADALGNPGYYQFTNLEAGNYFARFIRPSGFEVTTQNAPGSTAANDSDADPSSGLTAITTLSTGETDFTWDMGLQVSTTAAMGDYVWFDRDGNGIQDESVLDGINGVTVRLYQATDPSTPVQTTTTADDLNGRPGYYRFEGLTPLVDYFVEFELPGLGTHVFTTRHALGTPPPEQATDSDPDTTTGRTASFNLTAGQYDSTWDAGIVLESGALSLGDRVWIDASDNGIYEPGQGEVGVNNVRLNLYLDDGDNVFGPGDVYYTATTTFTSGGPGFYEFLDLPPGDFIVVVDHSNFVGSGPLKGYVPSSNGGNAIADPDDNVDDDFDQNGYTDAGGEVVSFAITLEQDEEPVGGDYNPTLDFGFRLDREMSLGPLSEVNDICSSHTVTATVLGSGNAPVVGVEVTFEVTSGPNAGASGSDTTDANGQATFTWISNGTVGQDTVSASVAGVSAPVTATKTWQTPAGGVRSLPRCDVDGDGEIDRVDYNGIVAVRNQPASGVCDQRDADANGTITLTDAKICIRQCTNARCASLINN